MTDIKRIIRGAKGGDPSPPKPTREPDTLHSRQYATFLDLISEGEIEGFATASKEGRTKGTTAYNNAALKDVFLNDTPVIRASADSTDIQDVDRNFQNVTFTPRFGVDSQTPIPNIDSSVSTTNVGVEVTKASPVTRQITNTNVDKVRVSVTFPQLQRATDEGDLLGAEVSLSIAVQYNSGGFTTVVTDTVKGRSGDAYQRDYGIQLTGAFPVDIRVSRVTDDATDTNVQDTFQWTSFGEIVEEARNYNNSAYTALRLDSMQFSSIPDRKFRIRGIKVRIPGAGASSSGTPTVDSATGRIVYPDGYIFNGVMGAATWCSCPAMILLDLLTTSRYGFGDHITDSSLDLFSFVNASKFANTLVDDGQGGQEARFSCNVNIQSSKEAFELINELAGVMRCMPIWSAGSITITQDKPTDPSYLFNLSNVGEAGFSYAGSSLKTRHSVVSVSYFNMDSQEIDFEVHEDTDLIAKIGTVVKKVQAFGCTSRGQARRLAKAIVFAENNESEVCTFTTSIDSGVIVRPGAVIEIQDPVRAGVRRGGRLKSVTSTTVVTVDDTSATDFAVDASGNPVGDATLSVLLPDGTSESRTILSVSNGTITVTSAFSQTPNVNTIWLISNVTTQSQLFRVITVEEQDGINYAITALSYVEGKYAFIEDGEALPARTVSKLNALTEPPAAVNAVERIFPINNQAVSKIIISWQPIVGVTEYQVNYRFGNDNFISEKVARPDFEIINSRKGTYTIQVFSYNVQNKLSATSTNITFEAVGKTALPADITNLTSEPISDQFIRLRFDQSTDVDVIHGGNIVVRFTPEVATASATFENSTDVIPALAGNISETLVPALSGTYSVKARDDGGRFSENEAQIVVTRPEAQPLLGIQTRREDTDNPPFQGEKTSVLYQSTFDGLLLTGTTLFDAVTDFDALASVDFGGPISSTGTYEFASPLDLGAVFVLNLERRFKTAGILVNDLFDTRTGLIDTWTDFDGDKANDVNAVLQVATTQADPAATVTGTYAYSGLFVTITKSSHGFSDNDHFVAEFTSGSGIDGEFKVSSVTNDNVFVAEKVDNPTSISSSGNVTIGVAFTRFNTFINGETKGRGFKFRALLSTSDPAQNINVQELGYVASFKPRQENSIENSGATNGVFASGTNTKTVTFQHPFFVGTVPINGSASKFLPSIGITLQNAQAGDFFTIHNITGSTFQIDVKNGSSFVDRNFTYIASGFGKGG